MSENTTQFYIADSSETAVEQAADELRAQLLASVQQAEPVLLLLAGGSATKLYTQLALSLPQTQMAANSFSKVCVAVGDERWPEINNTAAIEATGFIAVCQSLGASFLKLPTANDCLTAAQQYQSLLAPHLTDPNTRVIAVIGIGGDGHILSVNSDPQPARFATLFSSEFLVTGYTSAATTAQFPQYPQRITLTLRGLQYVDSVICLVTGDEKKSVLTSLQQQSDLPVNTLPALSLTTKNVKIFTDQRLS